MIVSSKKTSLNIQYMLTNKLQNYFTNHLFNKKKKKKMVAFVTKMNMTPNSTFLWYSYGISMQMVLKSFLAKFQSFCSLKTGKVSFFVTFDPLLW